MQVALLELAAEDRCRGLDMDVEIAERFAGTWTQGADHSDLVSSSGHGFLPGSEADGAHKVSRRRP